MNTDVARDQEPRFEERHLHECASLGKKMLAENAFSSDLADRTAATLELLMRNEAVREALLIVGRLLPEGLLYHTAEHTYEVLTDAVMFALKDGLSDREIELIAIAAAFHDTGFAIERSKNEPIGATFARHAMVRSGGYEVAEIRLVEQMIMDTQLQLQPGGTLVQISTTTLSGYVLDADLANFGRENFFTKSRLVFEEMAGREITDLNYPEIRNCLTNSYRLVSVHQWHTKAALDLLQTKKVENETTLSGAVKTFDGLEGREAA